MAEPARQIAVCSEDGRIVVAIDGRTRTIDEVEVLAEAFVGRPLPERVDIDVGAGAELPLERLVPPGVPVVRTVRGARRARPFNTPPRLAVSPRATLPDAIRLAVAELDMVEVVPWKDRFHADVLHVTLDDHRLPDAAVVILEAWGEQGGDGRRRGAELVAKGAGVVVSLHDPAGVERLYGALAAGWSGDARAEVLHAALIEGAWRHGEVTTGHEVRRPDIRTDRRLTLAHTRGLEALHMATVALTEPRVVNVWVEGPSGAPVATAPTVGSVALAIDHPMSVNTVDDVRVLPEAMVAAAAGGGVVIDVVFTSPGCTLDGVAPADDRWATVTRRLALDTDARSGRLAVAFTGAGFIRVVLSWNTQVLQTLRVDLSGEVRTHLEYAASDLRDFTGWGRRTLAITLNEVQGVHAVGVLGQELAAETISIRPDFFERFLPNLRDSIEAAALRVDTHTYAWKSDNAEPADIHPLDAVLRALAPRGSFAFQALFSREAAAKLRAGLVEPATIQVAGLAAGQVVPWAFLYDLPLDPKADVVCRRLFEPGGVTPASACREKVDCPLRGPDASRTICPWGFWGFRHQIELPPMRVSGPPRPLERTIGGGARQGGPTLDTLMGVNTRLPGAEAHRLELAATSAISLSVSPEQTTDAARQLEAAFADRDPQLIYLYCHGGTEEAFGVGRPWLSVGADERVYADELRHWQIRWSKHPLVLVNGCGTARIEPAALTDFVAEFAEQGASGVIGTETRVWEPLAREVAKELMTRLAAGARLGDALQQVRLSLLARGNPLGLVYTAYASLELRVEG